jgi:hypothetical protein
MSRWNATEWVADIKGNVCATREEPQTLQSRFAQPAFGEFDGILCRAGWDVSTGYCSFANAVESNSGPGN